MVKLLCATIGVPLQFACPPLCSPSELAVFNPIYTTATPIQVEAADSIALLVKSYRTNQVYNTNGGVTEDETLVSIGPHWIVSKEYERQLKGIAKRFHCEYETCVMVDQSFRVKRARGKVNVNGRYVVWYERTSDYGNPEPGDLMGSWFDITLTNEAPDIKLWEVHDEKMARTAHNIHVQQELAESGRVGWCEPVPNVTCWIPRPIVTNYALGVRKLHTVIARANEPIGSITRTTVHNKKPPNKF